MRMYHNTRGVRSNTVGNFKTFCIFGYEKWGGLKPDSCEIHGKVFKPLIFGLWIRIK